jgi:CheY-like chemotaxis protein
LILLDAHLPDMNGADVLRMLKLDSRCRGIPVVALSADATATQIERLRREGARAYLTKPVDVEELFAAIDEALKEEALVEL